MVRLAITVGGRVEAQTTMTTMQRKTHGDNTSGFSPFKLIVRILFFPAIAACRFCAKQGWDSDVLVFSFLPSMLISGALGAMLGWDARTMVLVGAAPVTYFALALAFLRVPGEPPR